MRSCRFVAMVESIPEADSQVNCSAVPPRAYLLATPLTQAVAWNAD